MVFCRLEEGGEREVETLFRQTETGRTQVRGSELRVLVCRTGAHGITEWSAGECKDNECLHLQALWDRPHQ